MGRPRKFCAMCTPRTAEDMDAARRYWAERRSEEERRRSADLRAQVRMLRERETQRARR
jgi:hypothetical protein